ncbi:CrcB family protein [Luteimonas sp. RD2P54]|uniref:Fluoride-specific ion channel FluC n=1 Tax=Luteimonas endophytica TaxID=3042023 RepID=A0ABT6J7B4_9GAMM|nr:CrcB family protein [Luteimonas endophytica]MDH5822719.1 CrcB family protein [Luteimonas endophytica]
MRLPLAVWVAFGSALGAAARWGVSLGFGAANGAFPWATLVVNVAGSMLIALYAAATPDTGREAAAARHAFVGAGFCGGFTTFSLFTSDLLVAAARGAWALAAAILAGSVAAWLAGAVAGHAVGRRLRRVAVAAAAVRPGD